MLFLRVQANMAHEPEKLYTSFYDEGVVVVMIKAVVLILKIKNPHSDP